MRYINEKVIPLCITGGIILTLCSPLPFGNVETWSVSLFEIVTFLTFGVWLAGEILKGRIHITPSRLYLPFGLFFIVILLQIVNLPEFVLGLLSPHKTELFRARHDALSRIFGDGIELSSSISLYPFLTREKLLLYLSYAAFFFVVSNYVRHSRQIKRFFWIIFAVAVLETVIGLLQYIASGAHVPASGTYINPNHFAGLLLLAIPLFLGYVLYSGAVKGSAPGRWQDKLKIHFSTQMLLLFATSLTTIGMILAQSRGAIFSFVVSILFFYILISRNKKSGSVKLLLGAFFILVIIYSVWIGLDPVIEKFSETTRQLPARTSIWKDSLNLIRDFPVAGSGLGNFNLAYTLYKKEAAGPYIYDHAHNDYIELAVETGIPGFALVMWGLISFFTAMYGAVRDFNPKRDPLRFYLLLGCLCGLLGMMAHAITEFTFQIPSNAYYFTFLLGLCTNMYDRMMKNTNDTNDDP
jgi:O-antigen ligase